MKPENWFFRQQTSFFFRFADVRETLDVGYQAAIVELKCHVIATQRETSAAFQIPNDLAVEAEVNQSEPLFTF